jgi:hypothetical protein
VATIALPQRDPNGSEEAWLAQIEAAFEQSSSSVFEPDWFEREFTPRSLVKG